MARVTAILAIATVAFLTLSVACGDDGAETAIDQHIPDGAERVDEQTVLGTVSEGEAAILEDLVEPAYYELTGDTATVYLVASAETVTLAYSESCAAIEAFAESDYWSIRCEG